METRVAQTTDRDSVMQLLSSVWSDDYVPEHWDDWVEHLDKGVPLLAIDQGSLVGVAYVHFMSERVAWFQALRVHPDARRLGVGTELSQSCLRHARRAGRQVARLLIDGENHASASMTERAGFQMVHRYCKLHKEILRTDGPAVAVPTHLELPALLGLAETEGHLLWHSNWEARDLCLSVLELALQNGSLRVLPDQPTAAVADVIAYDQDFDVSEPVGEAVAVLALVHGLEQEALNLCKQQIDIFISERSPHLDDLVNQAGYRLIENDGHTIWEYPL